MNKEDLIFLRKGRTRDDNPEYLFIDKQTGKFHRFWFFESSDTDWPAVWYYGTSRTSDGPLDGSSTQIDLHHDIMTIMIESLIKKDKEE